MLPQGMAVSAVISMGLWHAFRKLGTALPLACSTAGSFLAQLWWPKPELMNPHGRQKEAHGTLHAGWHRYCPLDSSVWSSMGI